MTLKARAAKKYLTFDIPLSYRINDENDRFLKAQNVISNQGRLELRNGIARYNQAPIGAAGSVLSTSFFKDTSDTNYVFVKESTVIYQVSQTSAHTTLKSGLTASTKHRGLTLNNRHIFAVEADGLFQYDPTNGFTQLGQAVPASPTVALGTGAGSLSDGVWRVKLTFYSTLTGFETNGGAASSAITTSGSDNRVELSVIPGTADNATIDKVRIYASKDGGSYFYADEINLGVTTYNLDDDPSSADTPPLTNAPPQTGGGKYLTEFNERLVYSGNSAFPNDVFFSEQNLPDAFDDGATARTVFASGNGPVTGLATGLYNDSNLDPYLVIFKRNTVVLYSELGDNARQVTLSNTVGCISNDTIEIRNGDIFFMSSRGWHAIVDGRLIKDSKGNVLTLGNGDIDDIFTVGSGYENELNISQGSNFHSVYYPTLDQYITWVSDAGSTDLLNAYVFEFSTSKGFKSFSFPMNMVSSTAAQDDSGDDIILMGDECGYLYKYSIKQSMSDVDSSNILTAIDAQAILTWVDGQDQDMATSYNFRDIFIRGSNENSDLTVKGYIDFDLDSSTDKTLDFPLVGSGFILDLSMLDVDSFGDSRAVSTVKTDINKTGRSFALGFFQNTIDSRMQIIRAQIDYNKNGNRN